MRIVSASKPQMELCFYAAYQGSTSLSACSDEITVIQYNNICLSAQLYRNLIFARCLFMHRCLFKFVNTMKKVHIHAHVIAIN